MTRDEKRNLRRRASRRDIWRRFESISKLPLKLALMACFIIGAVYVQSKQEAAKAFADSLTIPAPLPEFVCNHLLESYLVAGSIALIVLLTYPFHRKMVSDGCLRIALTNAAGETPTLLCEYKDRSNPYVRVWELSNPGIPLKVWEDKQLDLELIGSSKKARTLLMGARQLVVQEALEMMS